MTFFEHLNDNNNKAVERMQHKQHVFLKEITIDGNHQHYGVEYDGGHD